MPESFLNKGLDFLIHVQPLRVKIGEQKTLESIEFSKVTMRIEGTGDEAYTLVEMTRLETSSISSDFYSEIVLLYRAPQLVVSTPYNFDSTVTYLKKIPRSMKILPN